MFGQSSSKKRYFGLTVNQVVILCLFGLATVVVVGVGGWWILGMAFPANALPTETIPPTFTPLPSWTPGPTRTRVPSPTATGADYQSSIPQGWVQFTSGKVELWMPPNFVKADPGKDLILAKDKNAAQNFTTNVLLGVDPLPVPLDEYISESVKYFPGMSSIIDMTLLEKRVFTIGDYEVRRLRVETIVSTIPVEAAMYLVKDNDKVWMITCSTYFDEYYDWLPTFDKIARTFRINP